MNRTVDILLGYKSTLIKDIDPKQVEGQGGELQAELQAELCENASLPDASRINLSPSISGKEIFEQCGNLSP